MKTTIFVVLSVMLLSSLAFPQAGSIGVFADTQGLSCDLDNSSALLWVYCVHVNAPAVTACQFRVEVLGTPLTWLGDTAPFPSQIGNSQTGVAISYGACLASPIHLLIVTYYGVSDPCDMIRVVEDTTATPPGIYAVDCDFPSPNRLVAAGGAAYINDDGNCPCDVSSEYTSWGRIKSLYR